ncbi:hypothetical protein [Labilibaculum euxinus]
MRKIQIIAVLILITGFSNAKPKEFVSKKELFELQTNLTDSIHNLNSQLKELNEKIILQQKQIEIKQKNASGTIEYLSTSVGTFGVIFTVLTCLIAIVTLGLPVLTYQFGIKPSRIALKELEINMDSRLEEYLRNTRNKQIGKAIENLLGENAELKNQGLSFLSLTHHEGFSDEQMFKIYKVFKKYINEQTTKNQLAFVLSSRKNDYADELFTDKQQLEDDVVKTNALMYFAKVGVSENMNGIKALLTNSDDQLRDYFALLAFVNMYSTGDLSNVINSPDIISYLKNETLQNLKTSYISYLGSLNLNESDFKETDLYRAINASA